MRTLALLFAVASLTAGLCLAAETPRHPDELELPPLSYQAIEPAQDSLACGIPLLLFENHDLPLVSVSIIFPMGSRYLDTLDIAAGRILNELWRSGGTEDLAPDSLDTVLSDLNVNIHSWMGGLSGGVTANMVSEDMAAALPLWRDVAIAPALAADRLDQAKKGQLQRLQAINNDPGDIADMRLRWLINGRGHGVGSLMTRDEIDAVSRDDLLRLHRRFVHPQSAVIGVSGDFDRERLFAELDRLFADWVAAAPPYEPLAKPERPTAPKTGVFLLPGDYAQSHIRIGRLIHDLNRHSPDYSAVRLLDFAFGYGRVFYRSRGEGLSYGTGVMLRVGDERSSIYGLGSGRAEVTVALARLVLEEMANLADNPLTRAEIETAKIFRIGQELSQDERGSSIVGAQMRGLVAGRPADFRARYIEGLSLASVADIQAAAEKYIIPADSLVVLVVGDPARFDAPLEDLGFGPVQELVPYTFGE